MSWSIHHVNLPAPDVRASAKFYSEILGLTEGVWSFPPADQTGYLSADPARMTIFPCPSPSSPGRTASTTTPRSAGTWRSRSIT